MTYTSLELVDTDFISDGGFFVDLGELGEIVSNGTINGGGVFTGGNGDFGVFGGDLNRLAFGEVGDKFSEELGWDRNNAILRTRNGKEINYGHIKVGSDKGYFFIIYADKDIV